MFYSFRLIFPGLFRKQTRSQKVTITTGWSSNGFEDEKPIMTMADVKRKLFGRFGFDSGFENAPKSRDHLLKYIPKPEELPPRRIKDSFTSALLPLSTDTKLQDLYAAYHGNVRFGRLLEDIDIFAVWVCLCHIYLPNLPKDVALPYSLVTILADEIDFTKCETNVKQDIRLSGQVSWVGRSSMEVMIWLDHIDDGSYKNITRAIFLMAARNANNTAAAPVNPLQGETEKDCKIIAEGEERVKRRKESAKESIFRIKPDDDEEIIMYDVYKKTTSKTTMQLNKSVLPKNSRWMADWGIETTLMSFPQDRNTNHTIFGGFLMRLLLESSWVTALLYMDSRPILERIFDISFKHPVPIASILKLHSYVIYSEGNYIVIMTTADIINAKNTDSVTSNIYYSILKSEKPVFELLPKTYQETIFYLHGRRKLQYFFKDHKHDRHQNN